MSFFWRAGLAMAIGSGVWAAPARGSDSVAEALMERVRLSMPEVPLELEASLRVLDAHGRSMQTIRAAALLTPREDGRTVRYTLFDAFGGVRGEMTAVLGDGPAEFAWAQGDPPQPAPLPDLFGPVEGSEISWMELSFSYFWWPHPRLVGTEQVANRWECQIIEIDCPVEYRSAAAGGANGDLAWSHIRLWVAPTYNAVVRGEAWRGGRAVKRFEVQSVKKLRRVYMIGDLEVRNLETGARARLKVGRMKMISPDYSPEELEEFNAPVEW
ncbi:MAG: hypothetical protein KBC66_05150 [Kiritimatiellae bacterium]|nr:hypothetical protein [Kiritimatiellia bacterium]NLD90522.1 hypothetical protein [Lentisphaerota bacterium]HPC19662.1 hypothetical protein [Kiritimatiellia bacterium]HQN79616.1 hypothetical protein [Kiritimatiellia bacterium]HQQ60951.1 hypothetical protein [Kiritimatiellia bacterium]